MSKKLNKHQNSMLGETFALNIEDLDIIKQLKYTVSTGFALQNITDEETSQFLSIVNKLKVHFTQINKISRRKFLSHVSDVITNSNTTMEDFAIACILLSILELSCIRNSDHLDTEANDFEKDLMLIFDGIPYHSENLIILNDLLRWAYNILIISFRQVYFWFINLGFGLDKLRLLDHAFVSSNLPNFQILQSVFKHQSSDKFYQPFCLLKENFDFLDILLLSLKVVDFDEVKSAVSDPKKLKLDSDISILELSDQCSQIEKQSKIISVLNKHGDDNEKSSLQELESLLDSPVAKLCVNSIHKIVQLKDYHAMKSNKEESLRVIGIALRKSHHLLSLCLNENVGNYERIICDLLRLWAFMTETKHVLKYLPQSYLYVTPLIAPKYQLMTLDGFIDCLSLQAIFLVKYTDCFRSSVINNPHWYIDMLVSMISAIIHRFNTGIQSSTLVTDSICLAIADIGRACQQIFNTDLKNKMSRCAKVPLESYVCRLTESSTPLPPIVKRILTESCVNCWIECIDSFSLEQTMMSLKPGPREILKRLISNYKKQYKHSVTV